MNRSRCRFGSHLTPRSPRHVWVVTLWERQRENSQSPPRHLVQPRRLQPSHPKAGLGPSPHQHPPPVPCRDWGSCPLPPSPTFHASSHSPRVCFRHRFQPCSLRRSWDCIPTRESKSLCGGFKGLGRAQSSQSRDCSHPLTLSWNIERGRDP